MGLGNRARTTTSTTRAATKASPMPVPPRTNRRPRTLASGPDAAFGPSFTPELSQPDRLKTSRLEVSKCAPVGASDRGRSAPARKVPLLVHPILVQQGLLSPLQIG